MRHALPTNAPLPGGVSYGNRGNCRVARSIQPPAAVSPYSLQGRLRSSTICVCVRSDVPSTTPTSAAVPPSGNQDEVQAETEQHAQGVGAKSSVSSSAPEPPASSADSPQAATGELFGAKGTSKVDTAASRAAAGPGGAIPQPSEHPSSPAVSEAPDGTLSYKWAPVTAPTGSTPPASKPPSAPQAAPAGLPLSAAPTASMSPAPSQPVSTPPSPPTTASAPSPQPPASKASAAPKRATISQSAGATPTPTPSTPASKATPAVPSTSSATAPAAPSSSTTTTTRTKAPGTSSINAPVYVPGSDCPETLRPAAPKPPPPQASAPKPLPPQAAAPKPPPPQAAAPKSPPTQASAPKQPPLQAAPSNAAAPSASAPAAAPPPSSTSTSRSSPPSVPATPSAEASPDASTSPAAAADANQPASHLQSYHLIIFALLLGGGGLFACMTLQFTSGMDFSVASTMVWRRLVKSVAFRQLVVITGAMLAVRFLLDSLLGALAKFTSNPIPWDKSKLYYILKEVYQPLEVLLFIAALCTMADSFLPSLMSIPKATVSGLVRTVLSTSFILIFARVVFNLKSRFCKENAWQAEMQGDVTTQRRWEAYDKLCSFIIYVMSFVLGIQAIGLEVTSVLAIGGIGGLAIGLAGREICENLFNGFLIMSTNPFVVGDEVVFFYSNRQVGGIVIDIGWYRTLVRSFEREVYVIPNAVFSKNIVLNVTRKHREWRFYENLELRLQDVQKANQVVQDIRRIIRNDTRIMGKLHRRVFLDKINPTGVKIYLSFYVDASNEDAYMSMKQDLLLAFIDCVQRNGCKLASPHTVVDLDDEMVDSMNSFNPVMPGFAAAQSMAHAQAAQSAADMSMPIALPDGRVFNVDASSSVTIPLTSSTTIPVSATTTTTIPTSHDPSSSSGEKKGGGGSGRRSKSSSASSSSRAEATSAIPVSDVPIVYPVSNTASSRKPTNTGPNQQPASATYSSFSDQQQDPGSNKRTGQDFRYASFDDIDQ